MKKIALYTAMAAFVSFLSAGCAGNAEFVPSTISLDELETRQKEASDPLGRYASAKSSVLRQEIEIKNEWPDPPSVQMVEVKYQAPDKFRLTTFEENQPVSAVIINGAQGWVAQYADRSVTPLDAKQMKRVKTMQLLATPASRLKDIYQEIKIEEGAVDGEKFFRLTCINPGENPLELYVSAVDFLPRRIRWTFEGNGQSIDYDSTITRYQMFEGMLIPDESTVKMNETVQKCNVMYYKLDIPIPAEDFRPPVF